MNQKYEVYNEEQELHNLNQLQQRNQSSSQQEEVQGQYPMQVPDDVLLQQSNINPEKADQLSFVRKVLGIVMAQVVFTLTGSVLSS